jgi:tripartite-type tricarboxylate transporter receptor subunit TctC
MRPNTMSLARRKFLQFAVSAAALETMPNVAWAEAYPSRAVRLIVTGAAGGTPDIVGRLIGQALSERLGQPVVIENKPGGGTNIGTEVAVKAAPDGYTLLLALSANDINASLYNDLHFNFIRDVAPVATVCTLPLVMEINPALPVTTISEFIAYAKADPGMINMASPGTGTVLHVAGELFKMMAGIDMVHVPYRGEALALTDLLAGRVQVLFGVMPASLGYIKSGKLRALGVTTARRQELLPDVPAIGELLPGYEASGWYGIVAPKGTPAEIINKLSTEINAVLADPAMRARFADIGGTVFENSPDDVEKFIVGDTEKWTKVINFAGVRPD